MRDALALPILPPALERHRPFVPDAELRDALLSISPATIDRLLSEMRIAAAQVRRKRAGINSAVRRSVPVRRFADLGDPEPGFLKVDFVVHSGVGAVTRTPCALRRRCRTGTRA